MNVKKLSGYVLAALVIVQGSAGAAVLIDFTTDDSGITLINGQAINTAPMAGDPVEEFNNWMSISSYVSGSGNGHLGPTIFDSDPCGPNSSGSDADLLVGLGNVLMLQADEKPNFSIDADHGKVFDVPDDEASNSDRGSIVFDFYVPLEVLGIDMVDMDNGVEVEVVLTDAGGKTRTYSVPSQWSHQINTEGPKGYHTLDLTTLSDQPGERLPLVYATATEEAGYDPLGVVQVDVAFMGSSPSGALDNLAFVPEPTSLCLLGGMTAAWAAFRRKRAGKIKG